MRMNLRVPSHIEALVPYPPGKPLEELERNTVSPTPSSWPVTRILSDHRRRRWQPCRGCSRGFTVTPMEWLLFAPETEREVRPSFRRDRTGQWVQRNHRISDSGLCVARDEVILPAPSFLVYGLAAQTVGARGVTVPLKDFHLDLKAMAAAVTERTRVIFVNNPNNPTGTMVRRQELAIFLAGLRAM